MENVSLSTKTKIVLPKSWRYSSWPCFKYILLNNFFSTPLLAGESPKKLSRRWSAAGPALETVPGTIVSRPGRSRKKRTRGVFNYPNDRGDRIARHGLRTPGWKKTYSSKRNYFFYGFYFLNFSSVFPFLFPSHRFSASCMCAPRCIVKCRRTLSASDRPATFIFILSSAVYEDDKHATYEFPHVFPNEFPTRTVVYLHTHIYIYILEDFS